jgi:hypothetical protein
MENKSIEIDTSDLKSKATVYETILYGKIILVALGLPISKDNKVFVSLYLVNKDYTGYYVSGKIGYFDFNSNNYEENNFTQFKFLKTYKHSIKLIEKYNLLGKEEENVPVPVKEEENVPVPVKKVEIVSGKEDEILSGKEGNEVKNMYLKYFGKYPIGNETSFSLNNSIDDISRSDYIRKSLKDTDYRIRRVKGDGNCFFYVVSNAFKSIGLEISIASLREIAKDKFEKADYQYLQERFNDYITANDEINNNMKQLNADIIKSNIIIENNKNNIDKNHRTMSSQESKSIVEKSNEQQLSINLKKESLDSMLNQKEFIDENLNDLGNFNYTHNYNEYGKYMLSNAFWAYQRTIIDIEKVLNIKMIILTKENNEMQIQCNENSNRKPMFYIITELRGNHYSSLTHKDVEIFTFKQLPDSIKQSVLIKCMSKNATENGYEAIEDFAAYKNKRGIN